jgi:serine/threonine-protein kinase
LLLPGSDTELEQADVLVDRALAFNAAEPYFLFAKGLAEYRRGRFEQTISLLKGPAARVLGPAPGLVKAMAQFRHGQQAESRQTLTEAVLSFDWQPSRADHRDIWIFHILRREAEALILPTLSAFLEGKHQPRDNAERLALVDGCQYMGYSFAAARLYADAFAQDPGLAGDFRAGHRVRAARAAALTGCDLGKDTSGLEDNERKRWRDQSLQWLRADLTAWNESLAADPENARPLVRQTLTRWRGDRDLTGVRERDALEKLSEDERIDFGRFWGDVNATLYRVDRDM